MKGSRRLTTAAVIVAAGKGLRAGGDTPKQYRQLAGKPVLLHTILAFARHPKITQVCVVINPDDVELFATLIAPSLQGLAVTLSDGGDSRAASVLAGLQGLARDQTEIVLIHDAARPLVSAALIDRVILAARQSGAAAPALAVSDTLWRGADGQVVGTVERAGIFRAQTPQGFDYKGIIAAHKAYQGSPTDDVQVAIAAGMDVSIVAGDVQNIKITEPADFDLAAQYLASRQAQNHVNKDRKAMDIRTGNGFDVHAFEAGDHVTLCGVDIAFDKGLKGHSDADVAMHAITDAIYGALGQGDIGQWFPPSDPQWKGAASDIFLDHAGKLAAKGGYRISNVDCTIICELPKIGPHAPMMRVRIAEILGISEDRVSVKATTSEQLGFTGRKEGIAALASATLVAR